MDFHEAKTMIAAASRIVGFSGAGISTESGVPDFRSPGGVWSANRTVYFQEFINNHEDRVEYWRQKVESWPEMRDAKPNQGHAAFAKLHRQGRLLGMITQNIDGLHQESGLPDEMVIELHGTTRVASCLDCGQRIPMDEAARRVREGDLTPLCETCGGFLKPATVSFGQSMPVAAMDRAWRLCQECEIFIAVGSSLVVEPAASFPA
ncbi:MAG: Sir2 family NAD-dependent protein deacetylase, partial [Planctomycetes bacterium]|nr:Sir2 family NAD-dependent protein deacetylase [Planctomycetota bacterium]